MQEGNKQKKWQKLLQAASLLQKLCTKSYTLVRKPCSCTNIFFLNFTKSCNFEYVWSLLIY